MAQDGLDDAAIGRVLRQTQRIALVGASNRPHRPSFGVLRFLLSRGYEVVPVNPLLAGEMLLGQRVVASLAEAVRSTWSTCSAPPTRPALRSMRQCAWARGRSGCNSASSTMRPRRVPRRRELWW